MGISNNNNNNFINSNEIHKTYALSTFEAGSMGTLSTWTDTWPYMHFKTTLQGKFKGFTTSRKRGKHNNNMNDLICK